MKELQDTLPVIPDPPTRSTSQPEPRKLRNSTSQSQPKPTQKTPHSKSTASLKSAGAKSNTAHHIPTQSKHKTPKEVKTQPHSKHISSKLKKKIHKTSEVKRDHTKKGEPPCIEGTADMPRGKFGDKEKKRVLRLLFQRQVEDWTRQAESRREGRELRYQN